MKQEIVCKKEGEVSNKERLESLTKKNEILNHFLNHLSGSMKEWTIESNSSVLIKSDVIENFFSDSKFLKNEIFKKHVEGTPYYPLNDILSLLENDLMYVKVQSV